MESFKLGRFTVVPLCQIGLTVFPVVQNKDKHLRLGRLTRLKYRLKALHSIAAAQ